MNILLIAYDNDSKISFFPMGLAYVASAIRDSSHKVTIYNQDVYHYDEEHLTNYLSGNKFDVVGVGANGGYYQYRKILKIANAIDKVKNKPIFILGGHLSSPEPEFFLKKMKADIACKGEGEITMVEVLDTLQSKGDLSKVKGIAFMSNGKCIINEERPLIQNIDKISFPAYDLFPMEHYVLYSYPNVKNNQRSISLISGRGCTFECNFCYRIDKGFRPRSNESIINEIKMLKEKYLISYFSFQDELLMNSKERTISLCKDFIKENLNISWCCNGRLNYASKNVLQYMKDSGCVFINYGIESLDNQALKNMNKKLTVAQIITGIENTIEIGISPGFNIIFGNIGENADILKKGVEFLLKYDDHSQKRTIRPVTPYPGSPLYYLAIEKGLINNCEDFYENKHINSDLLTVNFTDMTDDDYYKALHEANLTLLQNYEKFFNEETKEILDNLYFRKDVSFRGFRKI